MFTHLHVHTHYSVLDGMTRVPDLVDKCVAAGMKACALTDHGAMYGVYEFYQCAKKARQGGADFKPIFGIEAYCARRRMADRDAAIKAIDVDTGRESSLDLGGWHLILLAKNLRGYHNLCKLTTAAWTDGFYGKPRIDKELLAQHAEGVICCSACLGGEVAQLIMQRRFDQVDQTIQWFKQLFADDYYLEVQLHPCGPNNPAYDVFQRQQVVNPFIFELAEKHGVKVVATNDSHFLNAEDGEAHDRLLCLATGKLVSDTRRLHYTRQEWLKTPEEMARLFADHPEALDNTQEVADKCELIELDIAPQMPRFPIPADFGSEDALRDALTPADLRAEFCPNLPDEEADKRVQRLGGYDKLYRIKLEADYLRHVTLQGARERYGDPLPNNVSDQIDFELATMKSMGFPGYFLIVQDFIRAARQELGVWVGPGRGSAAGSVVAYCLGITDIDPLKYDLLFERFLNPDRISLPDIDTDFADDGRGAVIDWVTKKYGAECVAHIITYGTMATKSSIADVCRVEDISLDVSRQFTGLVPDKFGDEFRDAKGKLPAVNLRNCFKYVPQLRAAAEGPDRKIAGVLKSAAALEGTIRQVGIHACGIIIAPADISDYAPVCTIDDKDTGGRTRVTQYDGHQVESVGLIKMDFLGLSNLRQMRVACQLIKRRSGRDVDINHIPLDDEAVYRLYSEGRTVGVFQFESAGMQKYLKALRPTCLEDLIAMNALFRPGPMEYIPQFIRRKHGEEAIVYDLPGMEKYLSSTYGVTVYQEQVMLLSRLLAGFTRGESDVLRKAMGKKQLKVLAELKPKFIEGGRRNGHPETILEKIWKDWESFASYAFNKSHATCYAWIAYQTAWLKTHYPSEYLAALMSGAQNIADVAKFMDEARVMGLRLLGPDVNHSAIDFAVEDDGSIVFGLGKVKNVGGPMVESILREREAHGEYRDIFDFMERVPAESVNTKSIEALAQAGAFDGLGIERERFFALGPNGEKGSEVLAKYGKSFQKDASGGQASLFGALTDSIARPRLPELLARWTPLEKATFEKEVVGIYITAHPLDPYLFETQYLARTPAAALADEQLPLLEGQMFCVAGIVRSVKTGTTKSSGKPYSVPCIEDRHGSFELPLFGRDFQEWAEALRPDRFVCIDGRVERSTWGTARLVRKIRKVTPLDDLLRERPVRLVTFFVDISRFGEPQQKLLAGLLQPEHELEGVSNAPLALRLCDPKTGGEVSFQAPGRRVHIGPALVRTLEQLGGVVEMNVA